MENKEENMENNYIYHSTLSTNCAIYGYECRIEDDCHNIDILSCYKVTVKKGCSNVLVYKTDNIVIDESNVRYYKGEKQIRQQ